MLDIYSLQSYIILYVNKKIKLKQKKFLMKKTKNRIVNNIGNIFTGKKFSRQHLWSKNGIYRQNKTLQKETYFVNIEHIFDGKSIRIRSFKEAGLRTAVSKVFSRVTAS